MVDSGAARAEASRDDLLARLVEASPLPIAVVDVDTLDFVALSRPGAAFLGRRADADLPNVLDVTTEIESAQDAFALMRAGSIDGYEARRHLRPSSGAPHAASLAVRDLGRYGFPRRALVLVTAAADGDASSELPRLDPTSPQVCAGSTDPTRTIDRVSPEMESLLGLRGDVGRASVESQVHPDDMQRLVDALSLTTSARVPVSVTVRFRDGAGAWTDVHLVVAAEQRGGEPRLGFTLTEKDTPRAPASAPPRWRLEELEATLRRISNEIQALGLAPRMAALPTGEALPELADLSARQWEIVSRLVSGERVPAIARSMFLSQSTIRNHLSAVFAKLGVHSQQELIELLRSRSSAPPRSL